MPGPRGNHPKETNAPPRAKTPIPSQCDSPEQPPPPRLSKRNPPMPPPKEGPTAATSEAAPTEQGHKLESRQQDCPKDDYHNLSPQQTKLAAPPRHNAPHPSTETALPRTRPTRYSPDRSGVPLPRSAPLGETSHTTPHKSARTDEQPPPTEPTQTPLPPATRVIPSQPKASGRTVFLPPRIAKRSDKMIIGPTCPAPPIPDTPTLPLRFLASDHTCPSTKSERESTCLVRHSAPSNWIIRPNVHSSTPYRLVLPSPPSLYSIRTMPIDLWHNLPLTSLPWPGLTLPTFADSH